LKIRTEIIQENNQIISKKCRVEGNHIIIRKGQKGRGLSEWAPAFTKTCLLDYEVGIWPRKSIRKKLMVFHDAESCVEWDGKARVMEPATWDKRTASKWFDAQAIKQAGRVDLQGKNTWVGYLTLFMVILTFVFMLISSGRLRI
jgi:hypothetical protein